MFLNKEPLEIGVYPHDIEKIFHQPEVEVKFIDQNHGKLDVDKNISGVISIIQLLRCSASKLIW